MSATSTSDTPWYIVPADDKKNARLIISAIVIGRRVAILALRGLDMSAFWKDVG